MIRQKLEELAGRLARRDRWRAQRVREVLRFVEGRGSDMLVGARIDE